MTRDRSPSAEQYSQSYALATFGTDAQALGSEGGTYRSFFRNSGELTRHDTP
jgi:hypothetical protein